MSTFADMAAEAIEVARNHSDEGAMASSAKEALRCAEDMFDQGEWDSAYGWALTSLKYSVGILHHAYAELNCC